MIDVKIKKLWKGFASVRSTTLRKARERRVGLRLIHDGEVMTVPYDKILRPLDLTGNTIRSKFGGAYELYDFKWIPDTQKVANQNDDDNGRKLEAQRLF